MLTADEWFTPPSQADVEEGARIRFKIRGLRGTEAMDVDFHAADDGRMVMTARGGASCIRYGLLDWENIRDAEDKPVAFSPKHWKANIERLAPLDALNLALAIWDRTFLSETARKN